MSYLKRNSFNGGTSFYHDYETTGADTQRDRPTQFAGIRVDDGFNELEVFNSIYCKMQDDCLPQPMAFLVTRMMISDVIEKGIPEFEFANKVNEQFSRPNTTSLGYNTVNFDDEITRNMLHRNLMNPYDREWKNNNSRWDLINVMRLASAVFGDKDYNGEKIFNVPLNDEGKKSFRLENLSAANGIEHENAHDALSDVYATIGMGKKVYDKELDFYKKIESRRFKKNAQSDFMAFNEMNPVLLCSAFFGGDKSFVSFVLPIIVSKSNPNEVYCVKLDGIQDVKNILEFSAEDISKNLFEKGDKLRELGKTRPPITGVKLNACPVYLTISDIKGIFESDSDRKDFYKRINVDAEDLAETFKFVRSNFDLFKAKISEVFENQKFENSNVDVDLSIYSGGFPSNYIAGLKNDFVNKLSEATTNADKLSVFKEFLIVGDEKFKEQVFRVAFRSYPDVAFELGDEYVTKWNRHCHSRIHQENDAASISYAEFTKEIKRLRDDDKYSDIESKAILDDLEDYGRKISLKYIDSNSI